MSSSLLIECEWAWTCNVASGFCGLHGYFSRKHMGIGQKCVCMCACACMCTCHVCVRRSCLSCVCVSFVCGVCVCVSVQCVCLSVSMCVCLCVFLHTPEKIYSMYIQRVYRVYMPVYITHIYKQCAYIRSIYYIFSIYACLDNYIYMRVQITTYLICVWL